LFDRLDANFDLIREEDEDLVCGVFAFGDKDGDAFTGGILSEFCFKLILALRRSFFILWRLLEKDEYLEISELV
jgi:hypothetical protein